VNEAEDLAKAIIANYDNPLQGSTIDVPAHVESLLQSLGATTSDSGGKVTYYGSDPITPDRLPYGSISAISLAAKAILIAKIWEERTGEGQNIHIDVRKALRRLTPFLDGKWELVNGFPGRTDPYSPFSGGPDIVPTGDGKWIMFAEIIPLYASVHSISLNPRVARMKRYETRSKSGTVRNLKKPVRKRASPCRSRATSKTCCRWMPSQRTWG
jgi:crotonobetainyl-CoA:carnitine CoA-transferase CaiB-like acyl-CoA transferase